MGMSSSQARLLHLTARMHQIEYKAAKLEAEKLQMANKSRRVYQEYQNALEASKIQYKLLNEDASVTFKDATLAILENGVVPTYKGEVSSKSYLIKSTEDNRIWVTRTFADYYGINEEDEVQDPGTLVDYLTENGANTQPVMKTVTDYDNRLSVDPVENQVTPPSTYQINLPNTYTFPDGPLVTPNEVNNLPIPIYTTQGNLTVNTTPRVTSYEPSKNIPSCSVESYSIPQIDIITGGEPANTLNLRRSSSTYYTKQTCTVANQTFKTLDHMEYTFSQSDLGKSLQDLFRSCNFNDYDDDSPLDNPGLIADRNYIVVHHNKGVSNDISGVDLSTEGDKIYYTPEMTLAQLLVQIAQKDSNITFDPRTGKLKTASGSGQILYITSKDDAVVGEDNKIADYFKQQNRTCVFSNTEQTLGLNTKIVDFLFSDANYDESQINPFSGNAQLAQYYKELDESQYRDMLEWAIPSNQQSTVTFAQYFDTIKNSYGQDFMEHQTYGERLNFDYRAIQNGFELSTSWRPGATVRFELSTSSVPCTTHDDDVKDDNTIVLIDRTALAENIYLLEAKGKGTSLEDYNSNHNQRIQQILSRLGTVYNNPQTNKENGRALALLSESVEAALESEDGFNTWYSGIQNLLDNGTPCDFDSYGDKYIDKVGQHQHAEMHSHSLDRTINETYDFIINDSVASSVSPNTVPIDGELVKGTISAPMDDDIKEYFAYQMWSSDHSKTYDEYLSNLNGLGLDSYKLAILYNFKSKDGLIDALKNNNVNAIQVWINRNLESPYHYGVLDEVHYDLNQSSDSQYSVTNTSTPSSVTYPKKEEIIKYLGYNMYSKYDEKTPEQWIDFINENYNNINNLQFASILYEYNKGNNNKKEEILAKIHSSQDLSAYINSLNEYEVSTENNETFNFSSSPSGPEEHYVTMDSTNDIAVILARDIYNKVKSSNPDTTMDPNTVKTQIEVFGVNKLASLSSYFGKPEWEQIVTALASGINVAAVSAWANNKYSEYTDYRQDALDFNIVTVQHTSQGTNKGKVTIPTFDGLASNLVVAFRQAGKTIENESDVMQKLREKYGSKTQDDLRTLANINDIVCNYITNSTGDVNSIYNLLYSTGNFSVPANYYKLDEYDFDMEYLGRCEAEYGTKEVDTGETEWVKDDYYKELVEKWNILKQLAGNLFRIIDEPLASSYELVRNLVCDSGAYLLELNTNPTEKTNIFEMRDTNVSVETHLREVDDEKELKKAEAKYEADMRRIDFKDRQYDRELAALEAERNATKNEMETLKTVAKDNVDRTFKLFS